MKIEEYKVKDIKPYERNAKKHDERQIKNVMESIKQLGWAQPLVVDKNNELIIGHCRLIAAKRLGLKVVPVVRMESLTEEQAQMLRLLDNKLNESEWDMELLAEDVPNLDWESFDIDWELPDLEETESEIIEDEVPEPPAEPKAQVGDLYELGDHRVICGDSTDVKVIDRLMDGVKADMVFTDPPYGMNLDTDYSKLPKNKEFEKEKGIKGGKTYKPVIGDNEDFKDELVTTIFDNFDYCKEIFVWGGDYYPELLKDYKKGNYIVWDKKSNEGMENNNFDKTLSSNFELCWSKQKHKKDIVRVLWVSAFGIEQEFDHKRHHPTQKPTKLSRWFIDKYSKENDLIVDIYGGSGSTLIACEQLNRKCYMCELDPHYVDVIIERWEKLTGNKAELISEG